MNDDHPLSSKSVEQYIAIGLLGKNYLFKWSLSKYAFKKLFYNIYDEDHLELAQSE